MKKEARFISGPEGTEDVKADLVNKIKDLENYCGMSSSPDQPEYWDLMKKKLESWSDDDLKYIRDQYHLVEHGDQVTEVASEIWRERFQRNQAKKDPPKNNSFSTNHDDLRETAKKSFEGTDFKNIN